LREKLIYQAIRTPPRRHSPSPEMGTPESTAIFWLSANLRLAELRRRLMPERWIFFPENMSCTAFAAPSQYSGGTRDTWKLSARDFWKKISAPNSSLHPTEM